MGKADDMRKAREALHGKTAPAAEGDEADAEATDQGKCSVCRKLKAVQNGMVVSHQKGLGKMCPGSRKAPA